jgi:hypothetical protein
MCSRSRTRDSSPSNIAYDVLFQMAKLHSEGTTHLGVHCARGYVEYSISRIFRQKVPCNQGREGPRGRDKANLDDIANKVEQDRVRCANAVSGFQKCPRKENYTRNAMGLYI